MSAPEEFCLSRALQMFALLLLLFVGFTLPMHCSHLCLLSLRNETVTDATSRTTNDMIARSPTLKNLPRHVLHLFHALIRIQYLFAACDKRWENVWQKRK